MDERISKALNLINDNLDLPLNVEFLAKSVFLSTSQFHRLFKRTTGKTPAKYVQSKKFDSALQRIAKLDTQVSEIALDLGFSNYETFSRSFKRQHNISPGDLIEVLHQVKAFNHQSTDFEQVKLIQSSYQQFHQSVKHALNSLNTHTPQARIRVVVARKSSQPLPDELLINKKYCVTSYFHDAGTKFNLPGTGQINVCSKQSS